MDAKSFVKEYYRKRRDSEENETFSSGTHASKGAAFVQKVMETGGVRGAKQRADSIENELAKLESEEPSGNPGLAVRLFGNEAQQKQGTQEHADWQKKIDQTKERLKSARTEEQGNWFESVPYRTDFLEKSKYVSKKSPAKLGDYSKSINEGAPVVGGGIFSKDKIDGITMLSPLEKNIYNYLYNTEGNDKANEYLRHIENDLSNRIVKKLAEEWNTPLKEAVLTGAAGFDSGMRGIRNASNALTGRDTEGQSTLDKAVAETRADDKGVQRLVNDILYSVGNMAPSMVVGGMAGPAGGALSTGLSSGGNSYSDAVEQGYGKDKAMLYGVASGLSEGGLQYALGGIGNLGKGGLTKAVGKIPALKSLSSKLSGAVTTPALNGLMKGVGKFASSAADEGTEEYLQALIDSAMRNVILGEDNEVNPPSEDALYSALIGGVTGGLFSVPESISSGRAAAADTRNANAQSNAKSFNEAYATENHAPEGTVASDAADGKVNSASADEYISAFESSLPNTAEELEPIVEVIRSKRDASPSLKTEAELYAAQRKLARIRAMESNPGAWYDKYAQSPDRWTASNQNPGTDKMDTPNLQSISRKIEESFKIPISEKFVPKNANGIYKTKEQAIRTQVADAMPTISHEVGHHFDNLYKLTSMPEIQEAVSVARKEAPGFLASYPENQQSGEAVAEFMRRYLTDRTLAESMYPEFYAAFREKVSSKDLKNLDEIGDMINRYMVSTAEERARAAVVTRKQGKKIREQQSLWGKFKSGFDKFNAAFIDDAAKIKDVSKTGYRDYMVLRDVDGKIRGMIDYGIVDYYGNRVQKLDAEGNPTGEFYGGLADITAKISGQDANGKKLGRKQRAKRVEDFKDYLIYQSAIDRKARGLRTFADDFIDSMENLQNQASALEAKHPDFKAVSEELYAWQNQILYTYGVETGLITQETYDAIVKANPHYVPFFRNVDKGTGGAKASIANQKAPIKKAHGGGQSIYDPYENILVNIDRLVKAGERNMVMQTIADDADATSGSGYLMERIPAKSVPVSDGAEDFAKKLWENLDKDSLSEQDKKLVEDAVSVILDEQEKHWVRKDPNGPDIVTVMRDGKPDSYQVHDEELLKALTSMNPEQANTVIRFVSAVSRVFKAVTTGWNMFFTANNGQRDIGTAYVNGSTNNPFRLIWDNVKAAIDIVTKSDAYKLNAQSGGMYQSPISNPQTLDSIAGELSGNRRFSPKRIIEWIEKFSDVVEAAPRLAETKRVLEKTGDVRAARYAGDEVTLNFKRHGRVGKTIDAFYPFFNPAVQGTVKNITMLKERPAAFLIKLFAMSALASILEMGFNHAAGGDEEYTKLSSYMKNSYYNIYKGNGKFHKIPKPQSLGVVASLIERAVEQYGMKNDESFYQFFEYLANQFVPPGVPTPDNPDAFLDDFVVLGSIAEINSNKDFKGSPIVPSNYQNLEPSMQYDEKTSAVAKFLGKTLNWSPMKIDHFLDSNFGFLARISKALTAEDKDYLMGLANQFTADSAYSTDSFNRFYDSYEKWNTQKTSHPEDTEALSQFNQYNSARSIVSVLNRLAQESGNSDYKKLAQDYALDFMDEERRDDSRLIALYNRTKESGLFPDKQFSNTLNYKDADGNQQEVKLDANEFLDYTEEYNEEIQDIYNSVLSSALSDEQKVRALKAAKSDLSKSLAQKYGGNESDTGVYAAGKIGVSPDVYFIIKYAGDTDGSGTLSQDEAKKMLNASSLSKDQKYQLWWILGSSWDKNPYGPNRKAETKSTKSKSEVREAYDYASELLRGVYQ